MDQMKERFAKLLLGEDMSGGGKGVSSALALSNAVTNLAASIFGEQGKLAPMAPERKARWRKEMDWLLSVTEHIVEFVPSQQKSKDGTNMEIMVTKQRKDLLVNIPGLRKLDTLLIDTLDNFGQEQEFWYVSKNDDPENESSRREGKWWHPKVKVPPNGLSETSRRWLLSEKEAVSQVLKAAMAINASVLSEIEVPESYIDSLPKNGRSSLGDSVYKSITVEYFDPAQFLSSMDLSTEHKVLDLKNRIEASIIIWKRKMHHKEGKSSWGSAVSIEKRELFEERVETILHLLKYRFPGLPQSSLDISKIQDNKYGGKGKGGLDERQKGPKVALKDHLASAPLAGYKQRRRLYINQPSLFYASVLPQAPLSISVTVKEKSRRSKRKDRARATGLSETSRRWLLSEKEAVSQVLKAAMAINASVLSEIEVPESYIDSLPKDIGHAILESYSRIIESLAFSILSRIEDVLHADSLAQSSSSNSDDDATRLSSAETPTLLDFMGWGIDPLKRSPIDMENLFKVDSDKKASKPPVSPTPRPPIPELSDN
ncbi:hypothetical protein GOBAR_AA39902 [Gossypium barbadense]|uniref:PRONE domain-containing protein n=1 Tax=Gossypium barbadense TaxID=3634 RepID=A0A2P5VPQ1_GOSBA|nr:hypothetical protein GOBAR_AA39902 [Gossypium barbadense]